MFLLSYTSKRTLFECASVVLLLSDGSVQILKQDKTIFSAKGRTVYPVLNTVDYHQDGWQKATESYYNRDESTSLRIIIKHSTRELCRQVETVH